MSAQDIQDVLGMSPFSASPSSPDVQPYATPADDLQVLPWTTRRIRAAGAGNIALIPLGRSTSVVCAFLAGETRVIMATAILKTGTTATGIEIMR